MAILLFIQVSRLITPYQPGDILMPVSGAEDIYERAYILKSK